MSNCPVEEQQHTGCAAWYCLDQRGCRSFQAIDEAVLISTMLRHSSDLAVLVQTGHMHGEPTPQAATEVPAIINLLRSMSNPLCACLNGPPARSATLPLDLQGCLKKESVRQVCVRAGRGGGACLSQWAVHLQNIPIRCFGI